MAGGGGPGTNSRGRGGKFKKFTRGGGKHFSRDLRPLDSDGNEISMWSEEAQKKMAGGSDQDEHDDSEDESSEEESDGAGPSRAQPQQAEMSREDRKREKAARKAAAIARAKKAAVQVGDMPSSDDDDDDAAASDNDDDMPANPNHSSRARKQAQAAAEPAGESDDVDEAADGVKALSVAEPQSRREREALKAQQAKERYQKLHLAGKTDEAKADLERLRVIREKRAADAARKQAEKEEREAQEKVKREAIEAKEAAKREAALGKPSKKGGKKGK